MNDARAKIIKQVFIVNFKRKELNKNYSYKRILIYNLTVTFLFFNQILKFFSTDFEDKY